MTSSSTNRNTRKRRLNKHQREMFLLELENLPKSEVMEDVEFYLEYSLGNKFKKMSPELKQKKVNAFLKSI